MESDYIVTVYVVIDDVLGVMGYEDDCRSQLSAAEILTVAVVAARYFQNHHERALGMMKLCGYITNFSVSRFNRRLHDLLEVFHSLCQYLGVLLSDGQVFVIDTCPIPVCRKSRAKRCKKVQGEAYEGYCASQKTRYFGWQLHLICDTQGVPVSFDLLPARWDELDGLQELLTNLPEGSRVVADKGYISLQHAAWAWQTSRVQVIAQQRKNMAKNTPEEWALIRAYRKRIEVVNSQLQSMGCQTLHARKLAGVGLKLLASLTALIFSNAIV